MSIQTRWTAREWVISCVTGFSGLPQSAKHWHKARSCSSPAAAVAHRALAVLEALPVIGLGVASLETLSSSKAKVHPAPESAGQRAAACRFRRSALTQVRQTSTLCRTRRESFPVNPFDQLFLLVKQSASWQGALDAFAITVNNRFVDQLVQGDWRGLASFKDYASEWDDICNDLTRSTQLCLDLPTAVSHYPRIVLTIRDFLFAYTLCEGTSEQVMKVHTTFGLTDETIKAAHLFLLKKYQRTSTSPSTGLAYLGTHELGPDEAMLKQLITANRFTFSMDAFLGRTSAVSS